MQESSFSGRFKVGTRIYTGFGLILALLTVVAAIGYLALGSAQTGFDRYASISDNSLRIAELGRDVSDMRRNVVGFIHTGSQDSVAQVRKLQERLRTTMRDAVAATTNAERRANLDRMQRVFDAYSTNFDKLVVLRARRDELVEKQLNVMGQKARQNLTRIIETAMADGDFEAAALAGQAQERLMLSRIGNMRFLASPSEKAADEVKTRNAAFNTVIGRLAERLHNPERKALAAEADQIAERYLQAFIAVSAAVFDADRLVSDVMVPEAEEFAQLADRTIDLQSAARTDLLSTTSAEMAAGRTGDLTVASVVIVLGIFLAFAVSRSIVRPVQGMTSAMQRLAGGDLAVDVPATADRDEIGEMAKSVLVFKENAIEKKRMADAEAERLEAERRADEAQRARERAIGEEIAALIDGVSRGDLSRRLDLAGKDGFYRTMAEGINRLTDTVANVITDLGEVLSALAAGDLDKRVARDYQGAFQRVKDDVNATSAKLAEIVGQITTAADTIASASAEVSAGSSDLADRTEQQASSLEETAASMEELGATVRSNAENAQRANRMAADARKAAENGGGVAGSAIAAMKRIESASRKITDIIGVIDEIAFQTNLLALNAAVEAARAGDAGRGFAVVAQEVRQLAQRSAQASKEIKALILDSDGQVRDGVELVKSAGDALNGIVDGVQQVAALIAEMASASTEQATALDEINATIAQMDEMTQKNAALVEEATAAAQAMAGQAGDLKEHVSFFKLARRAGAAPSQVTQPRPAAGAAAAARPAVRKPAVQPARAVPRPAKAASATAHEAAPKVGVLKRAAAEADDDWTEF
ncbi:HAMP domain-containing protein [Azospirillum sp. RWY-5-1]|uniref:HAMP domain-containing protein n=1 Tax=Azospirillum oleiclasticum TaxID=2735135 RepID=A0ABX2TL85_9PROT|nr:methyl-accepting chemotaxis protein [Azospirillum oleiclasticum]NYZ17855.1 HAMP domain-containing protein [Azospirillum oleiclasticum]NYZ25063.1 HAMP domain-containing protein [Azospirillum oleiclasticum]